MKYSKISMKKVYKLKISLLAPANIINDYNYLSNKKNKIKKFHQLFWEDLIRYKHVKLFFITSKTVVVDILLWSYHTDKLMSNKVDIVDISLLIFFISEKKLCSC